MSAGEGCGVRAGHGARVGRNHASKKLVFEFEPGTKVQYSGEGFEYLRKALEKKFGKPLAQLSRERLLARLDMTATHHAWDEHVDESRFARWHDRTGANTYTDYRITTVNAADNLLTTVEDYGRFAVSVLNGAGLSPTLAAEMVKPQGRAGFRLYERLVVDSLDLGREIMARAK